jgi:phage tail sheath protein FI
VAADGAVSLRVASTGSFYTGAKVELDSGTDKIEMTVEAVDTAARTVRVTPPAVAGLGFANAPVNATGRPAPPTGGSNGSALTGLDLIGADNGPGRRTGIQALSERDDISMVAVPGVTVETVQTALITHCERLRYRMAVLDSPAAAAEVTAIQAHRNNYDSKYAAYCAPWLKAQNSQSGRIETFPPSGYAMGIYARSDNTVGVHKAPADEVVRNITDVALPLTAAEQDVLNPIGVNLIRDLTPRGIRVWGARTISSDQEWKYAALCSKRTKTDRAEMTPQPKRAAPSWFAGLFEVNVGYLSGTKECARDRAT